MKTLKIKQGNYKNRDTRSWSDNDDKYTTSHKIIDHLHLVEVTRNTSPILKKHTDILYILVWQTCRWWYFSFLLMWFFPSFLSFYFCLSVLLFFFLSLVFFLRTITKITLTQLKKFEDEFTYIKTNNQSGDTYIGYWSKSMYVRLYLIGFNTFYFYYFKYLIMSKHFKLHEQRHYYTFIKLCKW